MILSVGLFVYNNSNAQRWIAPTSINSRDLVRLPDGTYVEAGSLQRDSNGNFIPPAGTATPPTTTAKWIPAEVQEIPFHQVYGAVPGQMHGKIQIPPGKEIVIFDGLSDKWGMITRFHSVTGVVFEVTYNGTETVVRTNGLPGADSGRQNRNQVWSKSIFVRPNQPDTEMTVSWELYRR